MTLFIAATLSTVTTTHAATISDYDFISAEIKKAEALSYEDVKLLFSEHGTLEYSCFMDESLQTANEPESFQVFGPYLSFAEKGTLNATVTDLNFGYNINIKKTEPDVANDLFVIDDSLKCIAGEEPGTCASFTISAEKPFTIEKPGDDFSDKATRTESWKIYWSQGELYAERSVDFEATELNWLGARKGSIDYSKRQVCHLAH